MWALVYRTFFTWHGLSTSKVQSYALGELINGETLAQVLTSEDGSFSVTVDETEYEREPAGTEPDTRHDILIMVTMPEDADSDSPPIILFTNRDKSIPVGTSADSSRIEQFYIRIPADRLREAGINPPNKEKESPSSKIDNYIKEKNSNFELNTGITGYHKTVVENRLVEN